MAKIKEKGAGSVNNNDNDGGTWLCYCFGQVRHLKKDCKVQGPLSCPLHPSSDHSQNACLFYKRSLGLCVAMVVRPPSERRDESQLRPMEDRVDTTQQSVVCAGRMMYASAGIPSEEHTILPQGNVPSMETGGEQISDDVSNDSET